jgi:hypothetical protein
MLSTRSLAISISCTLLLAPLVCAQDLKPPRATAVPRRPAVIQELALQPQPFLSSLHLWSGHPAPLIHTQGLSRYREFQLGMTLPAVAKQAGMETSDAKVIHQRPAMIEELKWEPQPSLADSSLQTDPVREILFSFYNGKLFQMVVEYDRYRTEAMTDKDMIEAISAMYGTATRPVAEITFSTSQVYNDSEKVVARWDDSEYSFNLFRSTYQPTFGMVIFSKPLDVLARAAIQEAIRLDEQGAPQREIARQKKQDEENRAGQEKARIVNKADFRP